MGLFDDIRTAVMIQRRRLHQTSSPDAANPNSLRPSFKTHQVDAMLRVEIDRSCEKRILWDADLETREQWMGGPKGRQGPITVDGVSWYVVNQLPDPGWRVINPMEPPRG